MGSVDKISIPSPSPQYAAVVKAVQERGLDFEFLSPSHSQWGWRGQTVLKITQTRRHVVAEIAQSVAEHLFEISLWDCACTKFVFGEEGDFELFRKHLFWGLVDEYDD